MEGGFVQENKKPLLIGLGVVVLIILIIVAVAPGGGPTIGEQPPRLLDEVYSDGTSVMSPDGLARVDIPSGATLTGGSLDEIQIIPTTSGEVFGYQGDYVEGPAYELLPDGLTFSEPVTLLIEGFTVANVIPLVAHRVGEEMEFSTPTGMVIDQGRGTYTAIIEIDHFSKIGLDDRHGVFSYELTSGGTANVGESLPFKFKVTVNTGKFWYDAKNGFLATSKIKYEGYSGTGGYFYGFASGGWYSVGEWDITSNGLLSPKKTKVSEKDNLKTKDVYLYETSLTCVEGGYEWPMTGTPDVYFRSVKNGYRNGEPYETYSTSKTYIIFNSDMYECKGKTKVGSDTSLGDDDFVLIGPPYTVICDNGTSFSGYYKIDKNGNVVVDAAGNKLDSETGKPVVCKGGGGVGAGAAEGAGAGADDRLLAPLDDGGSGNVPTATTVIPDGGGPKPIPSATSTF